MRALHRNPWFWAAIVGIATIHLIRPLLRREPPPPPVIARLEDFHLVDQHGAPFGLADLAGRVWVVDFIFTRCGSICPLLTASMARLERRLTEEGVDDVALLSITVDPEYDTPEVLAQFAAERGADAPRWTFLTGDPAAVRKLVEQGFKTPLGPAVNDDATALDIAHTGRFALVDGRGGIRGFYGTDDLGLDEVFYRAQHVLAEQRSAEPVGRR